MAKSRTSKKSSSKAGKRPSNEIRKDSNERKQPVDASPEEEEYPAPSRLSIVLRSMMSNALFFFVIMITRIRAPVKLVPRNVIEQNGASWIRLRDGRALEYVECGDPQGKALLAFPGYLQTAFSFKAPGFCEGAKEQNIRMISPSLPGFGYSDSFFPNETRKLTDWPDVMNQLTTSLDIENFYCLGLSFGAMHCAVLAAKVPERVLGAALVSSTAPLDLDNQNVSARIPAVSRFFRRVMAKQWIGDFLAWVFSKLPTKAKVNSGSPDLWKQLEKMQHMDYISLATRQHILKDMDRSINHTWRGITDNMRVVNEPWGFDVEEVEELVKEGKKVVVSGAKDDSVNPIEVAQWLHHRIKGSSFLEYEQGWNHYAFYAPKNFKLTLTALIEHEESCNGGE